MRLQQERTNPRQWCLLHLAARGSTPGRIPHSARPRGRAQAALNTEQDDLRADAHPTGPITSQSESAFGA